jgi:UMF1 family MFS transporter
MAISMPSDPLGAISDHTSGKKWYIAFFVGLGILGTGLFVVLGESTYILASVLFIMGNVGFAGANIFYESLLPHIATKGDIDQVSTRGYALGYVGGILGPLLFGVVSQLTGASRLSIVSLIIFFLVGGLILTQVNVDEGRRVAQQEDAELGLAPAS